MKNIICKITLSVLILFFAVPCFALRFGGDELVVTQNPLAAPYTYGTAIDISGGIMAWIDNRNGGGSESIYAARVQDANFPERLVDGLVSYGGLLRTDGRWIIYNWYDNLTGQNWLRAADISDINNPVIKDVNVSGACISSLDISNGIGVYYQEQDYVNSLLPGVYVFNTSEPNRCVSIYSFNSIPDEYAYFINSNVAIDDDLVSFCMCEYNMQHGTYSYYLTKIDVSDFNNPIVSSTLLPTGTISWAQTRINALDVSGDWLIAAGSYLSQNGIFAIYNYRSDSANWQYKMFEQTYSQTTSVRVDVPFAVWMSSKQYTPQEVGTMSESRGITLRAAFLLDQAKAGISILKDFTDPNWTPNGAAVSSGRVMWGADYYHYDYDAQTQEYYSDLFTNTLVTECGDKGYLLGDLDKNCKVDFVDFALMAENWLKCTRPDDETCIVGNMN
jgi:hypothetical protein